MPSWRDVMSYIGMDPGGEAESARPVGIREGVEAALAEGMGVNSNRAPRGVGMRSGAGGVRTPAFGFRGAADNTRFGMNAPSLTVHDTPYGKGWSHGFTEAAVEQMAEREGKLQTDFGGQSPWDNPFYAETMKNSGISRPGSNGQGSEAPSAGQPTSPSKGGGAWAIQDQWDTGYAAASTLTGVPANVIKAFQGKETGRETDYTGRENCEIRPESGCVALNSGIFQSTADYYGLDYARIRDDPNYAAYAIGVVLQNIAMDNTGYWGNTPGKTVLEEGGWEGVARVYYGGRDGYLNPGWQDERGVGETAGDYAATVMSYVAQLDARGTSPGTSGQSVSSPNNPARNQVGNYSGSAIADLADDYVNVPYVYGMIPTEDQDPYATGWDCSGFVYNIMDRLGYSESDIAGGVPKGSHYQAEWAIRNGRWQDGMDLSQMQPGDIIFFDTGANGGGGQNEVSAKASRATHVGIYLGDGKMINAMQECGPGLTMGVDCGTGIVSVDDGYWADAVIGWADTSDIVGGAAQGAAVQRGGPPPPSITGQGAASTAPVSTPAPSGTLPRQDQYGSTGNVR